MLPSSQTKVPSLAESERPIHTFAVPATAVAVLRTWSFSSAEWIETSRPPRDAQWARASDHERVVLSMRSDNSEGGGGEGGGGEYGEGAFEGGVGDR